jgi:hypothetical protein
VLDDDQLAIVDHNTPPALPVANCRAIGPQPPPLIVPRHDVRDLYLYLVILAGQVGSPEDDIQEYKLIRLLTASSSMGVFQSV